jgi:hypothetical protein
MFDVTDLPCFGTIVMRAGIHLDNQPQHDEHLTKSYSPSSRIFSCKKHLKTFSDSVSTLSCTQIKEI